MLGFVYFSVGRVLVVGGFIVGVWGVFGESRGKVVGFLRGRYVGRGEGGDWRVLGRC